VTLGELQAHNTVRWKTARSGIFPAWQTVGFDRVTAAFYHRKRRKALQLFWNLCNHLVIRMLRVFFVRDISGGGRNFLQAKEFDAQPIKKQNEHNKL
jgi:uncharacterized protein YlbG (UPF0298 family)